MMPASLSLRVLGVKLRGPSTFCSSSPVLGPSRDWKSNREVGQMNASKDVEARVEAGAGTTITVSPREAPRLPRRPPGFPGNAKISDISLLPLRAFDAGADPSQYLDPRRPCPRMQPSPSAQSAEKHPHAAPSAPPGRAADRGGQPQIDFSEWVAATSDPGDLQLGEEGFAYPDSFAPERLAVLTERFDAFFLGADPAAHAQFAAYRACGGAGMKPEAIRRPCSRARPTSPASWRACSASSARPRRSSRAPRGAARCGPSRKSSPKKRLFKASAGSSWKGTPVEAAHAARHALVAMGAPSGLLDGGSADEELAIAEAVLLVHQIDDTARKVAKAGGAQWTDELRERAARVRAALVQGSASSAEVAQLSASLQSLDDGAVAAYALDAIEAWLNARRNDHHDPARRWASLKAPASIDHHNLVQLQRPDRSSPSSSSAPRTSGAGARASSSPTGAWRRRRSERDRLLPPLPRPR